MEMKDLQKLPVDLVFDAPDVEAFYGGKLPEPSTPFSAGVDLRAWLEEDSAEIAPGGRLRVRTGLHVQPKIPGWAGFVYSRSGLGARDGVVVAQGVGVIDPDYTGEVTVYLLNTSAEPRRIQRGERIAQLIFQPYASPRFRKASTLKATERGAGGFGHTGR